jgi:hypothetical protein
VAAAAAAAGAVVGNCIVGNHTGNFSITLGRRRRLQYNIYSRVTGLANPWRRGVIGNCFTSFKRDRGGNYGLRWIVRVNATLPLISRPCTVIRRWTAYVERNLGSGLIRN